MPPSVLRDAPPRTLPVLLLGVVGAVFLGAAVTRDPASPVFAWQRRRGRGIVAPVLTHATWSTLMLLLLPR